MNRDLDELTVMADTPLDRAPATLRPDQPGRAAPAGFVNTDPLPAFARGDVTRLHTRVSGEAVVFSQLVRDLTIAVQRWVAAAPLEGHVVFLLGRRLERLRLAAHGGSRGDLSGFALASARQALAALPAIGVPPEVATKARRLADYLAATQERGASAGASASRPNTIRGDSPAPRAEAQTRLRIVPSFTLIAAFVAALLWYLVHRL